MTRTELHIVYLGVIAALAYLAYATIKSYAGQQAFAGGSQGASTSISNQPFVQQVNQMLPNQQPPGVYSDTGNNLYSTD